MSVIKINAITVPKDLGDEVARRFAGRIKAVDGRKGFQGFELMRPTDDRETWLVVTRWDTEEDFLAWVQSPDFAEGTPFSYGSRKRTSRTSAINS